MTKNTRWDGRHTAVTVVGVLLAIGIGWAAGLLVDRPDWLSLVVEVVVTLGLCLVLGLWLRSRTMARGAAHEGATRLR